MGAETRNRSGPSLAGMVIALTITTGCGVAASTKDSSTTDRPPVEVLVEERIGVVQD
jgi:hypothetical protein